MARILIVDDEPSMVMAIADELAFHGFTVHSSSDGSAAVAAARSLRPDVLLLDVMLPGLNGFGVCRELRAEMPDMWIIMLTSRAEEVDRVLGLELGADDYVTKPFSLREIVARIRVGLRRKEGITAASTARRFGDVEVDLRSRVVRKASAEIVLTRTEFEMLELFLQRAGEVITRDQFLNEVWGEDIYVTHRVIDTHILALRKKLEDEPENPRHIVSVRGVGYRLDLNFSRS